MGCLFRFFSLYVLNAYSSKRYKGKSLFMVQSYLLFSDYPQVASYFVFFREGCQTSLMPHKCNPPYLRWSLDCFKMGIFLLWIRLDELEVTTTRNECLLLAWPQLMLILGAIDVAG